MLQIKFKKTEFNKNKKIEKEAIKRIWKPKRKPP